MGKAERRQPTKQNQVNRSGGPSDQAKRHSQHGGPKNKIPEQLMDNKKSLIREPHIENYSGGVSLHKVHLKMKSLREGYHWVLNTPIGGDAPKDVIRVYKYGVARKSNPHK